MPMEKAAVSQSLGAQQQHTRPDSPDNACSEGGRRSLQADSTALHNFRQEQTYLAAPTAKERPPPLKLNFKSLGLGPPPHIPVTDLPHTLGNNSPLIPTSPAAYPDSVTAQRPRTADQPTRARPTLSTTQNTHMGHTGQTSRISSQTHDPSTSTAPASQQLQAASSVGPASSGSETTHSNGQADSNAENQANASSATHSLGLAATGAHSQGQAATSQLSGEESKPKSKFELPAGASCLPVGPFNFEQERLLAMEAELMAAEKKPQRKHGQASQPPKAPSSAFRGVNLHSRSKRWEAHMWMGRQVHLGTFDSELQAAIAYDLAVLRTKGISARPNFRPEHYREELALVKQMPFEALIESLRTSRRTLVACINGIDPLNYPPQVAAYLPNPHPTPPLIVAPPQAQRLLSATTSPLEPRPPPPSTLPSAPTLPVKRASPSISYTNPPITPTVYSTSFPHTDAPYLFKRLHTDLTHSPQTAPLGLPSNPTYLPLPPTSKPAQNILTILKPPSMFGTPQQSPQQQLHSPMTLFQAPQPPPQPSPLEPQVMLLYPDGTLVPAPQQAPQQPAAAPYPSHPHQNYMLIPWSTNPDSSSAPPANALHAHPQTSPTPYLYPPNSATPESSVLLAYQLPPTHPPTTSVLPPNNHFTNIPAGQFLISTKPPEDPTSHPSLPPSLQPFQTHTNAFYLQPRTTTTAPSLLFQPYNPKTDIPPTNTHPPSYIPIMVPASGPPAAPMPPSSLPFQFVLQHR